MHSNERMNDAGVERQIASFINTDLESKFLLELLFEFFVKLEHGRNVANDLSGSLSFLTAVDCKSKAVTHGVLRSDCFKFHVWLLFFLNRAHRFRRCTWLRIIGGSLWSRSSGWLGYWSWSNWLNRRCGSLSLRLIDQRS